MRYNSCEVLVKFRLIINEIRRTAGGDTIRCFFEIDGSFHDKDSFARVRASSFRHVTNSKEHAESLFFHNFFVLEH